MRERGRGGRGAKPIATNVVQQIIRTNDAQTLVTEAGRFGRELADKRLTKAQIRNIFGTVRQIEASWQSAEDSAVSLRQLLLLKPKLAYQAARSQPVGPLRDVLADAIDTVAEAKDPEKQLERFGRFVDLFEAILAYHTEAGGR
jgi:CRISPR-associated protein Csm2